ncbi:MULTISPECIES: hypothetical protein [Streptomyces]|uniref:hypothetical protein n=1 Tax=Streptomyces TaxID=1883 RepID=UPI0004C7E811|nr:MULTISPECIES: hypothetical protein [unclassified Streptomyces]KJY22789.1 hypothetical protein VR43_04270 [Streptomyces sp. NRRL S-104]
MPFEDDLGAALRQAGDGFTVDRHALVDAGEERGRRLVARRRAAVVGGSVLALAVIATAGAYTGGLLDGAGGADGVAVAAAPSPDGGSGTDGAPDGGAGSPRVGSGAVSAERMMTNLEKALARAGGKVTPTHARGTESEGGAAVSGVYDDGKGKAAITVSLSRVDPRGSRAEQLTQCGDKNLRGYDDCRTEPLPEGGKVLIEKGYEYSDRRVDTKCWRAVFVTAAGFLVEASEWNAPAEKDAAVTRPDPPLDGMQLRDLVVSQVWRPALNDLPAAEPEPARPGAESGTALKDRSASDALESLLVPVGIPIASRGGEGSYGYAVLDDGKGTSLVQLNVSKGASTSGFLGADVITQPDGTKVRITQGPAEKGKGLVQWTVDTLRGNGLRVTVSGFNAGNQNGPANRPTPAPTLEQLKGIALAPGWNRDRN